MSGVQNMSLHHNNNVSRSMNSINDRREIEFETNLFVDFSCFVLWAVFGIIIVAIFRMTFLVSVKSCTSKNLQI